MKYIEFINKDIKTLKIFLKSVRISKRAIDNLFKIGIKVNDKIVYKNVDLIANEKIEIPIQEENLDYKPIKVKLEILYEDENVLILNKEANLTVNSKNQVNLANYIANYFLKNDISSKIRFINRLDRDTSGIIMIAKNKYAQAYYQKEIESGRIIKKYMALVNAKLDIDTLVKVKLAYSQDNKNYYVSDEGNEAITYFKTLMSDEKFSLIECDIKTGKTHQIRATLKYLGHPILGDKLYGSTYTCDRFFLHSYYLKFYEFMSQESITIENKPDFMPFYWVVWKYFLA